jgi:hypothetical protein
MNPLTANEANTLTTEISTPRRSAVVLCGSGRFADAWHPFSRTSACLAEIIEAAGFEVESAMAKAGALHGLPARVPGAGAAPADLGRILRAVPGFSDILLAFEEHAVERR